MLFPDFIDDDYKTSLCCIHAAYAGMPQSRYYEKITIPTYSRVQNKILQYCCYGKPTDVKVFKENIEKHRTYIQNGSLFVTHINVCLHKHGRMCVHE